MDKTNEIYDRFVELYLFTNEEIELVTSINGYSVNTLNEMLYARYGYHDIEQYLEFEGVNH